MIKVGLIGLGSMGRCHLEHYVRFKKEGHPVTLTAICDIDGAKLGGKLVQGNINPGGENDDLAEYRLYGDIDEMLREEEFDFVDICLPTFLHDQVAIKALEKGIHVLCEKPMALSSALCSKMLEASRTAGKQLMIAHCLRFWPEYEYLKECVEDGRYGKVLGGYFFRGGNSPRWSYQNWMVTSEKSGGAIMDLHVHDADMVYWLFGKPKAVSTIARDVVQGNKYDLVSTNYVFEDGKVVNAQIDWALGGDFGFEMSYRVNFEKANLIFRQGVLKVNLNEGKSFVPELSKDRAYYKEIKYFAGCITAKKENTVVPPEGSLETIRIIEAERQSAEKKGEVVYL